MADSNSLLERCKLLIRWAFEYFDQTATVAGDHLRSTAVVVENAPKSLSRHDGASVIRACRQRCEELVAERGGSRRSYLLKAGTPSLFNRAATSAPALCVLTLLSM